jgi:hypothetical protein
MSSRQSVIEAWKLAACELQIRVTAPFNLSVSDHTFIAKLPDFGGPHGMVIDVAQPPDYLAPQGVVQLVENAGYYISLISSDIYSRFDAEVFKDALIDWGYWGPATTRPDWFPGA